MEFQLPRQFLMLSDRFQEHNFQLYLVGGAVRDLLLGKIVKDWDFTTDAHPEQILEILSQDVFEKPGFDGFLFPFNNNSFGTVSMSTPLGQIEITTMRQESGYSDSRHPSEVSWTDKIEEDLRRRDFTINAMAIKVESRDTLADLIDPFGGKEDLAQGVIRCVGDPQVRFQEDALRLMRAIRFACQLQFLIEEKTFQALKMNAGMISKISAERVRDELLKLLATDNPYEGLVMLRSSGLLAVILPEIDNCFGIKQEGPKHDRIYDIGEHSFRSVKYCPSKDPIIRFACLIHDVGKLPTYRVDATGNASFYGHDVVGAKMAQQICQRLRFSRKETDLIVRLVRWHLFSANENQTDSAIRRFVRNVGVENLQHMYDLREADRLGGDTRKPTSWRIELFKERVKQVLVKPFAITDLKVNGNDVMQTLQIPPGRRVGEILQILFVEVEEDQTKNEREYLISRIQELGLAKTHTADQS